MLAQRTRGVGRRGPTPLKQCDLDALCGVYAIINAIRRLIPHLGHEAAKALFIELLKSHSPKPSESRMASICDGTSRVQVRRQIKVARQHVARHHRREICVEWLGKAKPHDRGDFDWLWSTLTKHVDSGAVAIIGLGDPHSHWTIVTAVTPRLLRLADSGSMRTVRRSDCQAAGALKARDVFVFARGYS